MTAISGTVGGPARVRRRGRHQPDRLTMAVIALGAIALCLVVFFDVQNDVVLLDEYARRWTLQRMADGHGIAIWGANPGLVQLAVAAPAALLRTAPRFWRLSGIPFLAVAAVYTTLTARRLGADTFWAVVGALAVVCSPLTLAVATGIMNETVFTGLLAASGYYCLRWLTEDKGRVPAIAFAFLATLQRPQAATIVVSMLVAFAVRDRGRPRREARLGLFILGVASVAGYFGPSLLRSTRVLSIGADSRPLLSVTVDHGLALAGLAPTLGFIFIPLLAALVLAPRRKVRGFDPLRAGMAVLAAASVVVGFAKAAEGYVLPADWMPLSGLGPISVAIRAAARVGAGFVLSTGGNVLPPDWVQRSGLGPITLLGLKPVLWPPALFVATEVLIIMTFLAFMLWNSDHWTIRGMDIQRGFLLLLALGQFIPVLARPPLRDRYILGVALPLVPILAATAAQVVRGRVIARAWALAALTAGVGVYTIGEQDYIAWQAARDQAALLAYRTYQPADVDAGFEEVAVRILIPAMEANLQGVPVGLSPNPRARLLFAARDDPRPGVTYESNSPGKIVIVPTNP